MSASNYISSDELEDISLVLEMLNLNLIGENGERATAISVSVGPVPIYDVNGEKLAVIDYNYGAGGYVVYDKDYDPENDV